MMYYAMPHLTHAVATLPMALYIPAFYADEMGLPLAWVGVAIAASRVLDMFLDPLVGSWSDHLQTRWGRRKPWIALGTPLLMLAVWMVFVPGEKASLAYLFAWSSLLFVGFTLVDLPHKAWGAELSADYTERTHIAAWREGFGALGHLLSLVVLAIMGFMGHTDSRSQLLAVAAIIVFSLPPLAAVALAKAPELPAEELPGERLRGWRALRLALHNRAFVRTLIVVMLFGAAVLIQATLHKLVLTHVVGRPELFTPMILAGNVVSLAAVPLWSKIASLVGKHRAVMLAALWVGACSLAFPWVGQGDAVLYVTLILLIGCGAAPVFMLANAIAADVMDHDLLASGRQRTGLLFAVWGIAIKLAVSLGIVLATALPPVFGFEPSVSAPSDEAKQALLMVYGWLPCLLIALGAPLMWHFPIDHARQKELRQEIAARRVVRD